MSMVVARIFLRYLSGALMTAGFLDVGMADLISTDPDLVLLVGAGIGILTEGVYAVAKKQGWAT